MRFLSASEQARYELGKQREARVKVCSRTLGCLQVACNSTAFRGRPGGVVRHHP